MVKINEKQPKDWKIKYSISIVFSILSSENIDCCSIIIAKNNGTQFVDDGGVVVVRFELNEPRKSSSSMMTKTWFRNELNYESEWTNELEEQGWKLGQILNRQWPGKAGKKGIHK